MKTIKPQKLGILTRCFEFRHRFSFAVSVLMYVPLSDREDLYSEVSMWKFTAEALGKDAVVDAGIPKAKPEFLVTGIGVHAGRCAQDGLQGAREPGRSREASPRIRRSVLEGWIPSEPVEFATMPLDWQHAFGGEGFVRNPLGKGSKPVATDKGTIHWLPNIQYPHERAISPEQQFEPAGFGPLDLTWPQRFSKAGTHDEVWLKEDFPAYARDMDWTIFNLASSDQWFDQPLRGDEKYLFENMHPSIPVLEGRLPGLRARCFINRLAEEGERFEEVPTHLSTVWFFPHAERAILIFQGACEVGDEDGAEILHTVIGAERLEESKPAEHYREVFTQRLDKEKGFLLSLRDGDLLPTGMASGDPSILADKALLEGEDLLRKNMRNKAMRETERAREIVAGYGLDPDAHGPKVPPPEEPLPDLEHLPEFMERMLAEGEAQKKAAEEGAAKSLEETEKLFATLGMDFNVIRSEIAEGPKGPPSFSAQAQIDALQQLVRTLRAQGIETPEIEGYLADETFVKRLFDGESKLKENYRFMAHHQDPAPSMSGEAAEVARSAVQADYLEGRGFAGADLTGADLSGMDLHGADFEGAFLENVDFTGSNLTGCRFPKAVLAHACLKGAVAERAVFQDANLGGAYLGDAKLTEANLKGAIMAKADLTGAAFNGSDMEGADCSGAIFGNTDFTEVKAGQLTFLETDLRGLKATRAQMDKCNFLKVDVSGVDFTGASVKSAVFVGTLGQGARFQTADMTNVRFVQECAFDSADFTGARLNRANLRGSNLRGADFSEAELNGADLSGCDLSNARFYRSEARETRFVKADLRKAVMTSVNAMGASFQRADLRGADLRGANLFQVDLARVWADSETRLSDAYTAKVRVYPKRAATG